MIENMGYSSQLMIMILFMAGMEDTLLLFGDYYTYVRIAI
jgi:hypothetical protein